MPKCIIDGKEVEFTPGENLIEVAKRAHSEIPFFCYHPGLSVVAQCRMCVVEVEKMPKLQTACSTPVVEGMVVKTQSDRVKNQQKAVMEFLLINHPLDCPICDKAGECDLQDNSFKFGDAYMRTAEERRTYLDLDMGPVIQKNMNRCIHCTRCIRFGDEIAGIREMVAVRRGNNTEITTIDGNPLETEYAGNYSDICPTGSLTLKDFRFRKRAWYLKKTATVCEGCSKGCNMEIQHENNRIYRCVPRENQKINKWWLCDEGRFNYNYTQSEERVVEPALKEGADFLATDWTTAVQRARSLMAGKKVAFLLGSDLTQEEATIALEFAKSNFAGSKVYHFGTPGILKTQQDGRADALLKMKSKTANLNGLEKLGIEGVDQAPSGFDAFFVIRGGRAKMIDVKGKPTVAVGVFQAGELAGVSAVLPGQAFTEKSGTVYNFEGVEQKFSRSVMPPSTTKSTAEILMLWTHAGSKTGVA